MKGIAAAFLKVERAALYVSLATLMVMTCLSTVDALLRYFFSTPIEGADLLSEEILLPLLVYPAASYVYSAGGLVRVTLISGRLPDAWRRALFLYFDGLAAIVVLAIAYGVGLRGFEALALDEYSANPIGYLIAPSFFIVAIGAGLLGIGLILTLLAGESPEADEESELRGAE